LSFTVLIFVPIKYLSYSSPVYRKVTLSVGVLYGFSLILILLNFHTIDLRLVIATLFAPIYYVGMSLYLQLSGKSV